MTARLLVRRLWQRPAWAVVVLLVLAGAHMMGQLLTIAKVAYIDGRVEIFRYGSKVPIPAEIGMSLYPGDQIKTFHTSKCQLNLTATGILRLPPDYTVQIPTKENPDGKYELRKMVVGKSVKNFRQVVGLDPDEVFEVRDRESKASDYVDPPPPNVVAARAKEDAERVAQTPEGLALAEYRTLLPAVLKAERKPWHTRFEFIANAVKTGTGYRVAYKTYCLIDTGPDAGKDYACYEFDTVLDFGAVKAAIPDMRRRLGR